MENEIMNNEVVTESVAEVAKKVDLKKGIIAGIIVAAGAGFAVACMRAFKKKRSEKKAQMIEAEFEEANVDEDDSEEI